MNDRRIGTSDILLGLVLLFPGLVFAGGGGGSFAGATEMTQIMNNVELVIQSAQDEMQTAEMVQQTYLQRLQQMKSSIGEYTAPFQRTLATYQKVKEYQNSLLNLQSGMNGLESMLKGRFTEYAASNLTWQQWSSREQSLIQAGDQRARAEIQSNQAVLQNTQDSMDAYQSAAAGLEASTGTHQATRILGSQLTILGGDINKLVALTAQANTARALEKQEQAADRQQKFDDAAAERKALSAEQIRRKAVVDQLLGNAGLQTR